MGGSKAWDEIKVVGEATVKRRVDAGFQYPDLFHHLVRVLLSTAYARTDHPDSWTKEGQTLALHRW